MADIPNIALRAYQLWDAAGRPDGRSDEFYFAAEQELRLLIEKQIALRSGRYARRRLPMPVPGMRGPYGRNRTIQSRRDQSQALSHIAHVRSSLSSSSVQPCCKVAAAIVHASEPREVGALFLNSKGTQLSPSKHGCRVG